MQGLSLTNSACKLGGCSGHPECIAAAGIKLILQSPQLVSSCSNRFQSAQSMLERNLDASSARVVVNLLCAHTCR
jgi:carbamoylphosphate synthase large subunit